VLYLSMETLLKSIKLLALLILVINGLLYAENISGTEPNYNKVYRSDKIKDSYYFFLLTKDKQYYYLYTNKTDSLTSSELKSKNLIDILKKKQSWGQAFPKKGTYTISDGKIYTKLLWKRIEILSEKKIKYLNKTFYLK